MKLLHITFFLLALTAAESTNAFSADSGFNMLKQKIEVKYKGIKPSVFSENVAGVMRSIDTKEKIIAITLDACGGTKGSGFNRELINFLKENSIPATLFMTSLWIDANPELVKELAANPLFEIENHGQYHKPCSVNGASIYGRRGTKNPGEVVDEVELNALKIQSITGRKPLFYRPGTAFFDNVAVKIIYDLNYIPMNFSVVSGDANSNNSTAKIENILTTHVKNGSVIIAHMNQPGSRLYPALKKSIFELKKRGYRFVKLEDYKGNLN